MSKPIFATLLILGILMLSGCWSSKEIEERSVFVGIAVDLAKESKAETRLEEQGGITAVQPLITATIQFVPLKSVSGPQQDEDNGMKKYLNVSETGDSVFEIIRQYSARRDRAVIGHHLKVFIISQALAEQMEVGKVLDFMLRDNDIRPSCFVFLSRSDADEALNSSQPDEIPSFSLRDMVRNKFRNNQIMNEVTFTNIDQYLYSQQSFILQNIAAYDGESEFAGAGIIKGSTGKWIGNLSQDEVGSISWIQGNSSGGLLKSKNDRNETIIYEIKTSKSKITPKVEGEHITFHVDISSEGRLTENWDREIDASRIVFLREAEDIFEETLENMLQGLIQKLQNEFQVDVAGFGRRLSITHPKVWKKVKEDWDEVFSRSTVDFTVKLKITDYGSSKE